MSHEQVVSEKQLGRLAKQYRKKAGKTRAQAAREMKVSQTSIFQAEEMQEQALVKLRLRMIEKYSPYTVKGPVFLLKEE